MEQHQIGESIKQGQERRSKLVRRIKESGLGIISLALLVLDWVLLRNSLFGDVQASYWVWPALVTLVWVAAVSFFALVNPYRWTFFAFNLAGLIAYLFIMPRDVYVFIGGALFFLLTMLFGGRVQSEERSQLNFSIRRTLGNSQIFITYGLLLMLGFLIYSTVNAEFRRDPDAFYRKMAESAVRSLPYLSKDNSRFDLDQSVDEFIRNEAERENPEFDSATPAQQEIILRQVRDEFSRQFGVEAQGNESFLVAMTEVITQRIREVMGRYEKFFPLVFTLVIVALFRTFSFVFNWAVLLLSWVMYRILLSLRFFRIVRSTVEIEQLDL